MQDAPDSGPSAGDVDGAVPPVRTDSGAGPVGRVREASVLLRDILDLTVDLEADVGAELDVNRRDFEAMQHLVMSGPLSPTEIARRLDVSTAAATVIVDRLAAVGHVTRQPHPSDRRGVLVVPNPASVDRAMARILPLISGVDRVLDDFTTEEQGVITQYLARVVDVYRAQLPQHS
ncbi:DNA-binding MarR family transcriptional regulator [Marisediminicola sp. UYEF4]|uniref:MarR family transcriptional regulator n=1 Tax=Marisediminicola sp. UYEF4 TaxID=1756384 RepID=UPI00339B50BD